MVRQTVMPFKLKRTEEKITARSGLALSAEFFEAMDKINDEITEEIVSRDDQDGYTLIPQS